MGELGRKFRQHMLVCGYAESTRESYEQAMVALVRAYGGTSPDQLSCDQVQAFIANLVGEKKRAWSTVNAEKTQTIPVGDFIGRFLLHVLPSGFQKVRAYGWLASRNKQPALAAIRKTLGAQPPPSPPEDETAPERILRLTGIDVSCCPVCGKGRLICVRELHRARDGPT
jgi:hypothetical protein